jgi:hypothetical protein
MEKALRKAFYRLLPKSLRTPPLIRQEMTESGSKLLSNLRSLGKGYAKSSMLLHDKFNMPEHISLHLRKRRQAGSLFYGLHNDTGLRNGFLALHLTAVYHGGIFQSLRKSSRTMEKKLYQQLLLSKVTAAGFQKGKASLKIQKFVLSVWTLLEMGLLGQEIWLRILFFQMRSRL